jgi:hypothetical protein
MEKNQGENIVYEVECNNCSCVLMVWEDLPICPQCKSQGTLEKKSNLIDDGISKKEEEEEDVGGEQNLEDYPITKILNSISESEIQESGKTKYEIAAEILANNNSKKERENPGLRLGRLLPEQVKILEKKEKTKMLENKYQGKGGYIRFLQDPDSWKNIADRYSPKLNNEDIYTSIESDNADELFEKFCSIPPKSHPNLRESFYFIVMSLGKTVNRHIDLLISYDFKEKVEAIAPDFVKNNEEAITRAREHRLKSNKNSGCMSIFIIGFLLAIFLN